MRIFIENQSPSLHLIDWSTEMWRVFVEMALKLRRRNQVSIWMCEGHLMIIINCCFVLCVIIFPRRGVHASSVHSEPIVSKSFMRRNSFHNKMLEINLMLLLSYRALLSEWIEGVPIIGWVDNCNSESTRWTRIVTSCFEENVNLSHCGKCFFLLFFMSLSTIRAW